VGFGKETGEKGLKKSQKVKRRGMKKILLK
jgi:hypothetical protein